MFSDCSEMLILGKDWTTRHSMVSKQACTINHKMDQSVCRTLESIDSIHSSYLWIQTILLRGSYCQTMQTGTVSGLWIRWRSWRFKIHLWRNIVHIWKPHKCSCKLDVQETDMRVTQFNRIWMKSSLWTLDWDEMVCLLWNYGIWLFLFLEMLLMFQNDQGNLMAIFTNAKNLKRRPMR